MAQGMAPENADRMLAFFGLDGQYARVRVTDLQARKCGGCGAELATPPGARAVGCQSCGRKLDLGGDEILCRTCGAPLAFPVGISSIDCPYCQCTYADSAGLSSCTAETCTAFAGSGCRSHTRPLPR